MNSTKTCIVLGLLVASGMLSVSGAVSAATLDEVLDAHIAARGGDVWDDVEAFRMTGTFSSFSKPGPATVIRSRDGYVADVTWNEHPVQIGWDGEDAWRVVTMFGQPPWPRPVAGQDRIALELELDFPNPLFVAREKGYAMELDEEAEFEGMGVVAIQLTRPNEQVETWYLDPDTWLEVAREAPASEFGRPDRQVTVWDDFRDVGGLQIPHYEESQWYTRLRVYEIDEVELNPELDAGAFSRPSLPGMADFTQLAGDWNVAEERRRSAEDEWNASGEYTSTFTPRLHGVLVEETFSTPRGTPVLSTWSYDAAREVYRYTSTNEVFPYLDIFEGKKQEDGSLVVDNLASGTSAVRGETATWSRLTWRDLSADGFVLENESSTDDGETWLLDGRWTYTRPGASAEEGVDASE